MSSDLTHNQYELSSGVSMHVAEQGQGLPVIMCHGFPELWYSWREQMAPVAAAGFRAMAPDQRGYGDTSCPPEIEDYSQEKICGDLIALLDAIDAPKAIFVGHDWGGAVVWNMALHHPDRVHAVAGVNTPFSPHPPVDPQAAMEADPGRFDYQLYFQDVGQAEAEFEADVERSFKLMFRSSRPEDAIPGRTGTAGVRERGGLFVGTPQEISKSDMLAQEELDYFAEKFRKTGFRGGLNWYRNHRRNWEWGKATAGTKLQMPALMVTAANDAILLPEMTKGMEDWIPNLTRGHIENCAHWTQQEQPEELNRILVDWLSGLPKD